MDAISSDGGATLLADRRLSVTDLATSLLQSLPHSDPAVSLCLPAALLFARHLRFDSADPLWPDRDRLVLLPAAAALGQEAARQFGTPPDFFQVSGLALGTGVGLALAERLLAARFGRSLVDHRCWVIGTGADLGTGAVQEAAWLAGTWRLGRLTLVQSVGPADMAALAGFAAKGWSVRRATAGNAAEIAACLAAAQRSLKPSLVAIVPAEPAACAAAWSSPVSAEPPCGIGAAWRAAGGRAAGLRRAWLKRLARHANRADFIQTLEGRLPSRWHATLSHPDWPAMGRTTSTAGAIRQALPALAVSLPDLAALPPGTPHWAMVPSQSEPPRAHAAAAGRMTQGAAAVLCGLARHGGLLPWSVQSLADLDGLRPGLREAAAGGLQLVQLLIEPETGCPTAGQRASLRAMRNLFVFRPCDASEALECLELALRRTAGPSVLLLSESPAPLLADRPARTRSARGGYLVAEPPGPHAATLIASGSDLHLAARARMLLTQAGLATALVSLPCWALFARQDAACQAAVLGAAPRFGIEAGSGFGWERWLGPDGLFIDSSAVADHPSPDRRIAAAIQQHLAAPGAPPRSMDP